MLLLNMLLMISKAAFPMQATPPPVILPNALLNLKVATIREFYAIAITLVQDSTATGGTVMKGTS